MAFKMNGWSAFNKPEEQQGGTEGTSKIKQGINNIVGKIKNQFTPMTPSEDHMYSNRTTESGTDPANPNKKASNKPLKKKKYK
tara:strand:- start:1926 stop:2174 length:249 start_codon:yes stop_codon:yes gene_type:complete